MPDVDAILDTLKPFQRATVDLAFRRLWTDDDQVRRFLVADEVGLGKTMVAKGVIAKTVDHLERTDPDRRIDIIYICSNGQIARQNQRRLNVVGAEEMRHADRLTLLPRAITDLRSHHINFVSFTPETSFGTGDAAGKAEERVLLFHLLEQLWGRDRLRPRRWKQFFRVDMRFDNFVDRLHWTSGETFDGELVERLGGLIDASSDSDGTPLEEAIDSCVAEFNYLRRDRRPAAPIHRKRRELIAHLRRLVAEASVGNLEPDLVILDEFQSFSRLLDGQSDAEELAREIFDYPGARVLLLSATPYKMYTLPDEPSGEDHYRDFTRTIRFLAGEDRAVTVDRELRVMREQVVTGGDMDRARVAHDRAEEELRRVMCRTERLSCTPDRDGMLTERELPGVHLAPEDVCAWQSLDHVARLVDRQDTFEYWRSTPYPLNLMDRSTYKFRAQLDDALHDGRRDVQDALADTHGLLAWDDIEHYRHIDPGNAKMRGLVADVLDEHRAWAMAWVPPSLPYYGLGGAYAGVDFTKRLVFSAWSVVPRAIAVVLSYEAERRALEGSGDSAGRLYSDRPPAPPLPIRMSGERPANLAVLALMYPSLTLARAGDPLEVGRTLGGPLPVPPDRVLDTVRGRVQELLDQAGIRVEAGRNPDNRWYSLAPFRLDRALATEENEPFRGAMAGLADPRGAEDGGTGDGDDVQQDQMTALQEHLLVIEHADEIELGAPPENLAEVLALQAIAGLGVCALRALSRVCGGADVLADRDLRSHAFEIARGLRSLFNKPEVAALLHTDSTTPAWKAVLNHCREGCLQAVLDEYVHVLIESEGLQDSGPAGRAERLQQVLRESLSVRTATNTIQDLRRRAPDGAFVEVDRRVNSHLAARYGRSQTADSAVQRETTVRTAFNSPFRPFVLASTSVGQEGLDFHTYCHAIVHWNLPGNPVDMEQREGRVHRYKGHAVRRNVAVDHRGAALDPDAPDPWKAMFDDAARDAGRAPGADHGGMVPYWVYARQGGATIERYVPAMPLSRESAAYRRLLRTVVEYRSVMGQPRQEDLVAFLESRQGVDVPDLSLDLSPR